MPHSTRTRGHTRSRVGDGGAFAELAVIGVAVVEVVEVAVAVVAVVAAVVVVILVVVVLVVALVAVAVAVAIVVVGVGVVVIVTGLRQFNFRPTAQEAMLESAFSVCDGQSNQGTTSPRITWCAFGGIAETAAMPRIRCAHFNCVTLRTSFCHAHPCVAERHFRSQGPHTACTETYVGRYLSTAWRLVASACHAGTCGSEQPRESADRGH